MEGKKRGAHRAPYVRKGGIDGKNHTGGAGGASGEPARKTQETAKKRHHQSSKEGGGKCAAWPDGLKKVWRGGEGRKDSCMSGRGNQTMSTSSQRTCKDGLAAETIVTEWEGWSECQCTKGGQYGGFRGNGCAPCL